MLDPKFSNNFGIKVGSMCISLSHVDQLSVTCKMQATSGLNPPYITMNIHTKYGTKKIIQLPFNTIYTKNKAS